MSNDNPLENTIEWLKNMGKNVIEAVEMAQAMYMVELDSANTESEQSEHCPVCKIVSAHGMTKYPRMLPTYYHGQFVGFKEFYICRFCYDKIVYGR